MAIQPLPAHGTLNWDVPLNSILGQMGNAWHPSDQGWLSWTHDPANNVGSSPLATAGSVYMLAVPLRQIATVSSIMIGVQAPGVTLTAGQCFAGLYDSTGVRVGITADQAASWVVAGPKVMNLTAPALLQPGMYYVALVFNGTTGPTLTRGITDANGVMNTGLTAANFRISIGATAQTTLPANITMGSRTPFMTCWFASIA